MHFNWIGCPSAKQKASIAVVSPVITKTLFNVRDTLAARLISCGLFCRFGGKKVNRSSVGWPGTGSRSESRLIVRLINESFARRAMIACTAGWELARRRTSGVTMSLHLHHKNVSKFGQQKALY